MFDNNDEHNKKHGIQTKQQSSLTKNTTIKYAQHPIRNKMHNNISLMNSSSLKDKYMGDGDTTNNNNVRQGTSDSRGSGDVRRGHSDSNSINKQIINDSSDKCRAYCITTNKLSQLDIYLNMYRPNKSYRNNIISPSNSNNVSGNSTNMHNIDSSIVPRKYGGIFPHTANSLSNTPPIKYSISNGAMGRGYSSTKKQSISKNSANNNLTEQQQINSQQCQLQCKQQQSILLGQNKHITGIHLQRNHRGTKYSHYKNKHNQHRSANYQESAHENNVGQNNDVNMDSTVATIVNTKYAPPLQISAKTTIEHQQQQQQQQQYQQQQQHNTAVTTTNILNKQPQRGSGIKYGKIVKYFAKQSTAPVTTNNSNDHQPAYSKTRYMSSNRLGQHNKLGSLSVVSTDLHQHSTNSNSNRGQHVNRINLQSLVKNKNSSNNNNNNTYDPQCSRINSIQQQKQKQKQKTVGCRILAVNESTMVPFIANIQKSTKNNNQKFVLSYYAQSIKNKRNYNEDRYVAKSLLSPYCHKVAASMLDGGVNGKNKHNNKSNCMLFGIFDGHGGSACSQFLQKNIGILMQNNKMLITDPKKCMQDALQKLQQEFLKYCEKRSTLQTSGSTATVCLLCEQPAKTTVIGTGSLTNTTVSDSKQKLIIANIGDSRICALGSKGYGIKRLTVDHKPELASQKQRIIKNGGKLYKQEISSRNGSSSYSVINICASSEYQISTSPNIKVFSQTRILPGNLNVSRTIGDIEVKMKKYGGAPGVVSAQPELSEVLINRNHNNDRLDKSLSDQQHKFDTILLGSDGLYQGLTDEQIYGIYAELQTAYLQQQQQLLSQLSPLLLSQECGNQALCKNRDKFCEKLTKKLIKEASLKSNDNITVLVVRIR